MFCAKIFLEGWCEMPKETQQGHVNFNVGCEKIVKRGDVQGGITNKQGNSGEQVHCKPIEEECWEFAVDITEAVESGVIRNYPRNPLQCWYVTQGQFNLGSPRFVWQATVSEYGTKTFHAESVLESRPSFQVPRNKLSPIEAGKNLAGRPSDVNVS